MNRIRIAVVFFMAATSSAIAADGPEPVSNAASDEMKIRELEVASWLAWKTHDATFFEQFLADDHVEIHGYGITDKAAVVAGVRSPACVVGAYSLGPLTITRIAADTALVTYRAAQDTRCGGTKVPSPVWATSLYVKREGRWLNVMYQHTPTAGG